MIINPLKSETHWLAFLHDCEINSPYEGADHRQYRRSFVNSATTRFDENDIKNEERTKFFVEQLQKERDHLLKRKNEIIQQIEALESTDLNILCAIDKLRLLHLEAKNPSLVPVDYRDEAGKLCVGVSTSPGIEIQEYDIKEVREDANGLGAEVNVTIRFRRNPTKLQSVAEGKNSIEDKIYNGPVTESMREHFGLKD